MKIDDIINDSELKEMTDSIIKHIYFKYKLNHITTFDDFYQDSYLFLTRYIKQYDSEKSAIKSFIFTLVSNCGKNTIRDYNGCSKNEIRKDIRNNMFSLDYITDENTSFSDIISRVDFGSYERLDDGAILSEVMGRLSKTDNRIMMLISEGYTYREIAIMLNISTSTVYKHVKKVNKMAKQVYK